MVHRRLHSLVSVITVVDGKGSHHPAAVREESRDYLVVRSMACRLGYIETIYGQR